MRLGTIGWIERTGGRLAWQERLALIAQGVRARAAAVIRKRSERKIRLLEVDDILPPDSSITREAIALSQDLSKPFLFNHCMRSYFWAHLLDEDTRPFDDEAVFTALMLHDLGLTEHGRRAAESGHCFTQLGAQASWHASTDGAISAQLVAGRHGKEAKMVRAGSGADVAGLGLHVLQRDQIDEVVSRLPRLSLKKEMLATLADESRAWPHSRIAFLCHRLHFGTMIERSTVFSE
jgi:hypothetical protein